MSDAAHRLRGERKAVASGHLTLDRKRARDKLRQFRLPDPHFYVLQFVRAASILGATSIEFAVSPGTTMCMFDAAFDEGALEDIWSVAFESRTEDADAALHNLALGLASAQALNPEYVEVLSGGDELLLYDDGEEFTHGLGAPITKIEVKEKFRFGHITEFFESFVSHLPEHRALAIGCKHSLMDVKCNGVPVSTTWRGVPTYEEVTQYGVVKALGSNAMKSVQYTLLRDDVAVRTFWGEKLFLAGRAVLNSRDAQMDLTGLTLRETPDSFPREPRSVYHRLLLQWLERNDTPPLERRGALERLVEVVAELPPELIGQGTRELLAKLLRDPLFPSALDRDAERVALITAGRDVIEYSTRRVELDDLEARIPFLTSDSLLPERLDKIGYSLRDITLPLANRARRVRNKARFDAQPVRPLRRRTDDENVINVQVGELTGFVETTKDFQTGAGHVRLDGRVLLEREAIIPFRVEVNGPIRPNIYYDNVDRDDEFDELALQMIAAARRLFPRFDARPDHVALILNRLARGVFESDLLGLLGYGLKEAEKFMHRYQTPREHADDFGWLLRDAGALAEFRIFRSVVGPPHSLRDLVESAKPPLLSAWATPLANHAAARGRPVLDPTPAQRRLIELIFPDVGDVAQTIRREAAEAELMERAPFRPRTSPPTLHTHRVEGERYSIEMDLLGGSFDEGHADAYLVWRDRLVGRHRWSAPSGYWRVVVRSDELRAVDTFDDVQQDDLFNEITKAFARATPAALEGWRAEVVQKGQLQGNGWELYVMSALAHDAIEDIRLPAWRRDGADWVSVLAPLRLLASSARRNARLRYTLPARKPSFVAEPSELILQLPQSVDTRLLQLGPLTSVRIVFVDDHVDDEVDAFRKRAPRPSSLMVALAHHREDMDGFEVSTGLVPRGEAPRHVIELVWQNRVLERVEVADIASFRSIVSGDALAPDADLTGVGSGRQEAIAAAAKNARSVLIKASGWLGQPGTTALRKELLQLATGSDEHSGEPWWEALQRAPLLETSGGGESLVQRAQRLTRLRQGDEGLKEVARLLQAARGDRPDLVHDFTLAGLMWAGDQEALVEADAASVTVRRDHALVGAVESGDKIALHFLASCIYTQINAYYREISDADEVELQGRLLGTNL